MQLVTVKIKGANKNLCTMHKYTYWVCLASLWRISNKLRCRNNKGVRCVIKGKLNSERNG